MSNLAVEMTTNGLKQGAQITSDDTHLTNKPDFRELDLGSPVSTLRPAPTTSSSSSGSLSARKSHSGELSNCVPSVRPRHSRSNSYGSIGVFSGGAVNSPPLNVLPTGNICPSGRIQKGGLGTRQPARSDVLGSGSVNYGHGSIIRTGPGSGSGSNGGSSCSGGGVSLRGNVGPTSWDPMRSGTGNVGLTSRDPVRRGTGDSDPEELKRVGNEMYKKGNFLEALSFYDKAIVVSPGNAAYRSNRAAALTGLGRVSEAVRECEEAVKLDPCYGRAHHRLGSLLIRLGQVEVARKHLFYAAQQPEATELQKLQAVERHLTRCSDARKIGDWQGALREGDATIASGADHCPQLFTCRAECLLRLQQLDDLDSVMSNVPKHNPFSNSCSQSKFFGMLSEAYLFYVRAQIEMALGRFDNAVTCAEKAGKIDTKNAEITSLLNKVRSVTRARARGNDLFKSERLTEACAAYGEGLKLDPSNSVLYCNRAACWFKLGMWERSLEDCNHALVIQPNYTKALLRRAASYSKLGKWIEAVRDYEILRRELPQDNEVAESLFHAQVALKKSRDEEVYNMKFGGDIENITGLEHFKAEISSPGVSVVHFKITSNPQCKRISSFLDLLCGRYPSINFLKVDVEESPDVANAENVRIVPTFKIYKNSSRVKEIVNPTSDVLEASVRHYSL